MHVLLMKQPLTLYDEQKHALLEVAPALGCSRIRNRRPELSIALVSAGSFVRPYRFMKIFPPCPLLGYRMLLYMDQCISDPHFTGIPKEFLRECVRTIQHPELDLDQASGFELHERLGLNTVLQYQINALIALPEPEVFDHLIRNLMDRNVAISTEQLRMETDMDRISRTPLVDLLLATQGNIAVPPYAAAESLVS